MKIATDIIIDKPIAAVWDVVGTQFGSAHLWASALVRTEGSGRKISNQVSEARICDIRGIGRIREKLLEFDPQRYTLTYEVAEGFPFFVERGVNRWHLVAEGKRTHLYTNTNIATKGMIGAVMRPMMKMQMSGLMRKTLEDLKYYAENGVPHPRKQKTLATRKLARA